VSSRLGDPTAIKTWILPRSNKCETLRQAVLGTRVQVVQLTCGQQLVRTYVELCGLIGHPRPLFSTPVLVRATICCMDETAATKHPMLHCSSQEECRRGRKIISTVRGEDDDLS
jgi:hypothetical protein